MSFHLRLVIKHKSGHDISYVLKKHQANKHPKKQRVKWYFTDESTKTFCVSLKKYGVLTHPGINGKEIS